MKPHPRIRTTTKWGGAAATLLLVGVWLGSGWVHVRWQSPSWGITVSRGRLVLGHTSPPPEGTLAQPMSDVSTGPFRFSWRYVRYVSPRGWSIFLPLWPAAVASFLPTAWAWRLDTLAHRRARAGACPNCHYDRTGLAPSALCPECGSPARS
jgi:hypothetical protein